MPLLAPDLTEERLERAGLLISIAPARGFSPAEHRTIDNFLGAGGTLICMVGAEESRPSDQLLAGFDFQVPPSPVPPGDNAREPAPRGAFQQLFGNSSDTRYVQFYAGWPLNCTASDAKEWIVWSDGTNDEPIVVSHSKAGGTVVVIADTYFASNENLEMAEASVPDNIRFWRWLLSRVVVGQEEWNPPPAAKAGSAKGRPRGGASRRRRQE